MARNVAISDISTSLWFGSPLAGGSNWDDFGSLPKMSESYPMKSDPQLRVHSPLPQNGGAISVAFNCGKRYVSPTAPRRWMAHKCFTDTAESAWAEGLAQWQVSASQPEGPRFNPGLVERWISVWPSFPLKFTQLSILPRSVRWVPASMNRIKAAAWCAYMCFRSAGGELIIVVRL